MRVRTAATIVERDSGVPLPAPTPQPTPPAVSSSTLPPVGGRRGRRGRQEQTRERVHRTRSPAQREGGRQRGREPWRAPVGEGARRRKGKQSRVRRSANPHAPRPLPAERLTGTATKVLRGPWGSWSPTPASSSQAPWRPGRSNRLIAASPCTVSTVGSRRRLSPNALEWPSPWSRLWPARSLGTSTCGTSRSRDSTVARAPRGCRLLRGGCWTARRRTHGGAQASTPGGMTTGRQPGTPSRRGLPTTSRPGSSRGILRDPRASRHPRGPRGPRRGAPKAKASTWTRTQWCMSSRSRGCGVASPGGGGYPPTPCTRAEGCEEPTSRHWRLPYGALLAVAWHIAMRCARGPARRGFAGRADVHRRWPGARSETRAALLVVVCFSCVRPVCVHRRSRCCP